MSARRAPCSFGPAQTRYYAARFHVVTSQPHMSTMRLLTLRANSGRRTSASQNASSTLIGCVHQRRWCAGKHDVRSTFAIAEVAAPEN